MLVVAFVVVAVYSSIPRRIAVSQSVSQSRAVLSHLRGAFLSLSAGPQTDEAHQAVRWPRRGGVVIANLIFFTFYFSFSVDRCVVAVAVVVFGAGDTSNQNVR